MKGHGICHEIHIWLGGLALHQGNRDQHVTVLGPSQLGHALSTVCGGEGNGEEGED